MFAAKGPDDPNWDHQIVTKAVYELQASGNAVATSSGPPTVAPIRVFGSGSWHVEYFDNRDWSNEKCSEDFVGPYIRKDWHSASPCNGVNRQNWTARFTASIDFPVGTYVIHVTHDDGAALWVDGDQLLNDLDRSDESWICPPRQISGIHRVQLDYRQDSGSSSVSLNWSDDTSSCMSRTSVVASPTPTAGPSTPFPGCFGPYFYGIPSDRVAVLEEGIAGVDIPAGETKNAPLAVMLTVNRRPIAGIRFLVFWGDKPLLKIESFVDSQCHTLPDTNYENAATGSKTNFQDFQRLNMRLESQDYQLAVGPNNDNNGSFRVGFSRSQ